MEMPKKLKKLLKQPEQAPTLPPNDFQSLPDSCPQIGSDCEARVISIVDSRLGQLLDHFRQFLDNQGMVLPDAAENKDTQTHIRSEELEAIKVKLQETQTGLEKAKADADEAKRQWEQNLEKKDAEIKEIKEQLEETTNNLNDTKVEFKVVCAERDGLQGKCDDLQKQCDYFSQNYAAFDEAYNRYRALPPAMQQELAGIFGDVANPQGFLSGALNVEHLSSFWRYIASCHTEGRLSQSEGRTFEELFDFCFASMNRSEREPRFRRLVTRPGSAFDRATMALAPSSRQLGKVGEVLFEGYVHSVSGNTVHPSLVILTG